MADGVFGNPITNSTLEGMPEYGRNQNLQQQDRADVALRMKNAEDKNMQALRFGEQLRRECDVSVNTICLIYNATGDTVKFVRHYDWYGHIGTAPYPIEIANGQWGAFLHIKCNSFINVTGSVGAVVYRSKNCATGCECDWMMAWDNPWNKLNANNTVYTVVGEVDHFRNRWDSIYDKLENSTVEHKSNWQGCLARVSIGNNDTAVFQAILTLEDA